MSESAYTVKDIATIISKSNDPKVIERVVRQIRYWTSENVLKPLGDKHTGSGKHRQYDLSELYKAAIFYELLRYGISAMRLDPIDEYFDSLKETPLWDDAITGKKEIILWHAEESIEKGGSQGNMQEVEDFTGFNLLQKRGKTYLKLIGRDEPIETGDNADYSSMLMINITKLFESLKIE